MSLKTSINKLISISKEQNIVNNFVCNLYNEYVFINGNNLLNTKYKNYEIININTIKINYINYYGDFEYSESFEVDLLPYYREENLKQIIE